MTVMRPDELADPDNPDVACTLALQFLLRGGRVHLVVSMRGNDAMIGLVCDVFSFTAIQEFTAVQLGAQLGTYTHQVASMHVNEPDLARMDAILAGPETSDPFPDSSMPADTSWETIRRVLRWEAELRANRRRFDPVSGTLAPASTYWRQVLLLFEVYRQITHQPDDAIDAVTLAELTPAHRWLVTQRWPGRVGAQPAGSTSR